ncbi:uncharacterized protein A4U43_C08F23190 [Asparagus officinalis]|nr:uncharacterized protein A4U43_C08F23190 [Asparagus officinalis]
METDRLRLRKKTLQSVLEQCQRTLDHLKESDPKNPNSTAKEREDEEERGSGGDCSNDSSTDSDYDSDELCGLVKSKVDSPDFLAKLGSIHMTDDNASWDMIGAKDLWEDKHISGDNESDQDGYVLVKQEDIVEGIACFMAAYLLSLEQTKVCIFSPCLALSIFLSSASNAIRNCSAT